MKQSSIGTDIEKSEKKNIRLETDYQSSTQDQRYKRVNTKQVRGKIRKDELGGKGSSSNSSKASLNCPSSLSKSTSRRNEDVGGTKHQKKKSAAIPTRSTKALYSNNSEYEKKRNSKAAITALKPSFSTTHILSKPSHETIHSKMELNIKYPIYEKLQEEKSNENKRQSYNVAKSSRESRKLIEFKLNDDSESTQNNIEKESTNKLATQRSEVDHSKHKFLYPKSDLTKRLISHKSEHNFEAIQNKYGHNPGVKYTEKSSLHSSKGSRSDLINKPRCQTSRNTPFPSYKVVKSIKHNIESTDKVKSDRVSGKFSKNGITKPSQVKIYLKNEDE